MNAERSARNLCYENGPLTHRRAIYSKASNNVFPGENIISLVLVDKRPMLRECVASTLLALSSNICIHQVSQPDEVKQFESEASICLLAIGSLSIDNDWVQRSIKVLGETLPEVPIALLADALNVEDIIAALQIGVRGYLTTEMDLSIMIEAARFICSGGIYVPAEAIIMRREVLPRTEQAIRVRRPVTRGRGPDGDNPAGDALIETITPRELEVLLRLRLGKPNKIIAYELNMRESTVKVHVQSIMRKIGANNRTQVTYLTQALDLPDPLELPS